MQTSIDGCRAKIARAKELIEVLDSELSTILSDGRYEIVSEHEFQQRRFVFRLHGEQFPLRISVLAGEIIHHLRSTLDHLIWAGAHKVGLSSDKLRRITFPICATPAKFKEAVKNGALSGVSDTLKNFIESLQPYRTPDPSTSIVQILHDLDIIEKHRLLVVVTHAARMGQHLQILGELTSDVAIVPSVPPDPVPFFRAIENGVEVHWVNYETTTQPIWSIKNDFSIYVAFQNIGLHERLEAIPILWQLYSLIENIFSIIRVSSTSEKLPSS